MQEIQNNLLGDTEWHERDAYARRTAQLNAQIASLQNQINDEERARKEEEQKREEELREWEETREEREKEREREMGALRDQWLSERLNKEFLQGWNTEANLAYASINDSNIGRVVDVMLRSHKTSVNFSGNKIGAYGCGILLDALRSPGCKVVEVNLWGNPCKDDPESYRLKEIDEQLRKNARNPSASTTSSHNTNTSSSSSTSKPSTVTSATKGVSLADRLLGRGSKEWK